MRRRPSTGTASGSACLAAAASIAASAGPATDRGRRHRLCRLIAGCSPAGPRRDETPEDPGAERRPHTRRSPPRSKRQIVAKAG